MAHVDARNRLQPALLDRLTDDARGDRIEADDRRVMSKAQLRQAVLRDLSALFNAVQPLAAAERFLGQSRADNQGAEHENRSAGRRGRGDGRLQPL